MARNQKPCFRFPVFVMIDLEQKPLKTYIVVPKAGEALRVQAEAVLISPLGHSVRLFSGTETVALFDTANIIGVIEEASFLESAAG
jgi:hypothetical protein